MKFTPVQQAQVVKYAVENGNQVACYSPLQ